MAGTIGRPPTESQSPPASLVGGRARTPQLWLEHNRWWADRGLRTAVQASRCPTISAMSEKTMAPQRVAVLGAGMVGLSTAWFLQEHGVEVTVLDEAGVAAGSSWGNAGWLTPGIATPLPEPAVLKYGLRAVLSPSSPVYVPPSANPDFLRFVTGFTRHSTMKAWKKAMGALVPVNDLSLESFDLLKAGGVQADTI